MKFTLAFLLLLIIHLFGHGQYNARCKNDSNYIYIHNTCFHRDSVNFPYDPLDTNFVGLYFKDNSFKVIEGKYYDFYISRISKVNNGYLIDAQTIIDSSVVFVKIVSFDNKKTKNKKLKKGNTYKINLYRYFYNPLQSHPEYRRIFNIVLDNKVVSIVGNGFRYVFVSPNIIGKTFVNQNDILNFEKTVSDNELKVNQFINKFIQNLFLNKDTSSFNDYFDKHQFVSISNALIYCNHMYFTPNQVLNDFEDKQPKKITCRRNDTYLNENSPYHIFIGILRENSLAKTMLNSCPCKIENVSTKIIYINDKFYTIRSQIIFSNTAKLNITFVLFKAGNEFKITAISNNI